MPLYTIPVKTPTSLTTTIYGADVVCKLNPKINFVVSVPQLI